MKPRKQSVVVNGHKTSISLEPPFWEYLKAVAQEKKQSVGQLVSQIDFDRHPTTGLTTYLRVFCLREAQKSHKYR
ncbi:MAG: ribbon-helix-helix domain-containing protein [Pseudomonadota bacterium]|nr:ribbon-helix-helix domain-containing protein [Pseudomonadota bacterium]